MAKKKVVAVKSPLSAALAHINEAYGLKETAKTIQDWKAYEGECVNVVISDHRKFVVEWGDLTPPRPKKTPPRSEGTPPQPSPARGGSQ